MVLVEGYTDVLALHQAGIGGVVGTMGTALTEHQADALIRLAPTALLCLDADAAGIEAMRRGLESVERATRAGPGGGSRCGSWSCPAGRIRRTS